MVRKWDSYVENDVTFMFWIRPMEEALLVKTWAYLFLYSCKTQDVWQKEFNLVSFQLQLGRTSVTPGTQHRLYWTNCLKT